MKPPFDIRAVRKVAQMTDTTGRAWDVVVSLRGLQEPLVGVHRSDRPTPENHGMNSFGASTFVGIGGRSSFSFLRGLEFDEGSVEFTYDQWLPACMAVRAAIPGNLGQIRAQWIPDDGLPF